MIAPQGEHSEGWIAMPLLSRRLSSLFWFTAVNIDYQQPWNPAQNSEESNLHNPLCWLPMVSAHSESLFQSLEIVPVKMSAWTASSSSCSIFLAGFSWFLMHWRRCLQEKISCMNDTWQHSNVHVHFIPYNDRIHRKSPLKYSNGSNQSLGFLSIFEANILKWHAR